MHYSSNISPSENYCSTPSPSDSWRRRTKGALKSDTDFLFEINNALTHSYIYQPLILEARLILCKYLVKRFRLSVEKNKTKLITLTNRSKRRLHYEPITVGAKYM